MNAKGMQVQLLAEVIAKPNCLGRFIGLLMPPILSRCCPLTLSWRPELSNRCCNSENQLKLVRVKP